jgi:type I restriction enzyme S subunit
MSAGFKYLDLAALPDDWTADHFGNLVDYNLGRTPARNNPEYWKDGIYPWVSISDMKQHAVIQETAEKVSQQAFDDVFRGRLAPEGSLLMSFKLTIGRISRLGVPAFHNEAIISFQPDPDKISPEYLGYYLSQINYKDYQDTAIKGQTLNKGKLDSLEIALPPLTEQQAIAHTLNTVQHAIKAQERIIQTTTELKKALVLKLFSEGLRGEPQKMTEIGLVPASWEVVQLGEFFQIRHGFAFDGKFFQPSGKYILMTPGHFHEEGGFRDQGDKTKYFTGAISPDFILEKGSLVVAMTEQKSGLLGSSAFVPEEGRYLHNQRLGLIIDLNEKRLSKNFLFNCFNLPHVRDEIAKTSTGSKVKHTSPTKLRAIKVGIPPTLNEQKEIVHILNMIEQRRQAADRHKEKLEELFPSLLDMLMTARLRTQQISSYLTLASN